MRAKSNLTRRERNDVLRALETLTLRWRYEKDMPPCDDAINWLRSSKGAGSKQARNDWPNWLHWLGVALCQADVLEWPVFDPGFGFSHLYASDEDFESCQRYLRSIDVPTYPDPAWYWPVDLLLWGCRKYVRQRSCRKYVRQRRAK